MYRLGSPHSLWLMLIPLAWFLFFLFKKRSGQTRPLLPLSGPLELMRKESKRARWAFRTLFFLLLSSFCILVFVVARPLFVKPLVKKSAEGIDIAILLDVSESMVADDYLPSRIDVAKSVIRDFVKRRNEDRIGLSIFAGEAVTKSPLTRDYDFLLDQVDDVKLRELKQGTAIGMAIANAVARLRRSESKNKVIILLTDGDSNVGAINPITAAQLARQESIRIYCIGIGKSDRVVVPIYAYDIYGHKTQLIAQVPSYLNPDLLREISRITNGRAYMARDTAALNNVLLEIDKLEKTKTQVVSTQSKEDYFFFPALFATLLIAAVTIIQETRYRKVRLSHAASL
jgi:Ca-activated chloride channel homolog